MTQRYLGWTEESLASRHDVALLDLDGVVYIGKDAVPGVADVLAEAQAAGMRTIFVTNNAARPPSAVGGHLRALGLNAADDDVVTSAQAVSTMMARELPAGSTIFVMGGEGLLTAVEAAGLVPTQDPDADISAVVSGYHPDLRFGTIVDATILVRTGLPWYASNADLTLPTARGVGPGNGSLLEMVSRLVDRRPRVAGKPEPVLFQQSMERTSALRPLVVGDRLDTDIEGARRAGMDSLLVLTGVTGLTELIAATEPQRPTYLSPTLAGLNQPQTECTIHDGGVGAGGWRAQVDDGRLSVRGSGPDGDWWRVVAVAAWHHRDTSGEVPAFDGLVPPLVPMAET